MDPRQHWETVYRTNRATDLNWYERDARASFELIRKFAPSTDAVIFDIGGGTSTLVDALVAGGYQRVTVLDLSGTALDQARQRLGPAADNVTWLAQDLFLAEFPRAWIDVWHDRAFFHLLTEASERRLYLAQLRHAMRTGGHVIVAGSAAGGPATCGGAPVVHYTPESLLRELGSGFELVTNSIETHVTPDGDREPYLYCVFRVTAKSKDAVPARTGPLPHRSSDVI